MTDASSSSPEQIRQLIDKWWEKIYEIRRSMPSSYASDTAQFVYETCANQLEALLRSGGVLPQQNTEDERTEETR